MHMVVGFLLASLLKRKERGPAGLPSINGKFSVEHALPGRIRFLSPLLEHTQTEVIEKIRREMCQIEGIQSVKINARTGSLLVIYDEVRIPNGVVHAIAVKMLGLEQELEKAPVGLFSRELKQISRALDRQIHQSSAGLLDLTSSLMVTFLLLALYQIILRGDRGLPGGFSLLWWTYLLSQKGD